MAIYPLSGTSCPAKKRSSSHNVEVPPWKHNGGMPRRKEIQVLAPYNSRTSPRQWELRKVASLPILEADYWSDASLSFNVPPQSDIIQTKQLINPLPSPYPSTRFSTPNLHHPCIPAEELELPMKAPSLKTPLFPPPLDSPTILIQGRHCHMKTLERVRFQIIRRDGRLSLTEILPVPRRRCHLHAERSNARLVLRLHEDKEDDDEGEAVPSLCEEDIPPRVDQDIQAHEGNTQRGRKEEERHAQSGHGALAEDHDWPIRSRVLESARPPDEDNSTNVYINKVLRTIEPGNREVFDPIPQLQHGESCQVASFLHKSLWRVRPLRMLSIWQF